MRFTPIARPTAANLPGRKSDRSIASRIASASRSITISTTALQKYGNNETANRRENQQDRLAQGIKSGKLNAGQTARLERQEGYVNQENRADRKANGGNLTNKQRHQMNHQLNRESRRIYRNKH